MDTLKLLPGAVEELRARQWRMGPRTQPPTPWPCSSSHLPQNAPAATAAAKAVARSNVFLTWSRVQGRGPTDPSAGTSAGGTGDTQSWGWSPVCLWAPFHMRPQASEPPYLISGDDGFALPGTWQVLSVCPSSLPSPDTHQPILPPSLLGRVPSPLR